MTSDTFHLTADPTWPWSLSRYGLWALLLVALLLVGLTLWTYRDATLPWRRILVVLLLRLAALLLALLAVLRPALAFRDDLRTPSLLLIACDDSASMSIQDAYDGLSRWDHLRRVLRENQSALERLRDEHNISVVFHRFAAEVRPFDPAEASQADGPRSDYGQLLHTLLERYRGERHLRGLVILGDGSDNGTRHPSLSLAGQWRHLPCPIDTFGFGKDTSSENQSDVAITHITTEPSPVPLKGQLTVKATVDAPGFENRTVQLALWLDDKEVAIDKVFVNDDLTPVSPEKVPLPLRSNNRLRVLAGAPATPGDVKVTLQITPLAGELATSNNKIETFATVSREGISVLLVDKARHPEPVFLSLALAGDPRLRLYDVTFRNAADMPDGQRDLYQFGQRAYDVVIIGDVTPTQFAAGAPKAFETLVEMVKTKGTGVLFMGGLGAFGPSWKVSPLSELMPVKSDVGGQLDARVKLERTEQGKAHFVLRLADDPAANDKVWEKLSLEGISRLGAVKEGTASELLLRTAAGGEPVLAARVYGQGRVMAFAGDTTWKWVRPPDGHRIHARFWRQLVLWLAKQEESAGNAWVKPDERRLRSGEKLGFSVGLRGRGGLDLKDAHFEVRVIGPDGSETLVPTARDRDEERGAFFKTDAAGEYRLVVRATGKDMDGQPVAGEASARFLVSADNAEMARRAADSEFLRRLAAAGGGKYHTGDEEEFARFLKELRSRPLSSVHSRGHLWPDWRRGTLSAFLPAFFVLFVTLVALEWFLRRRWGMV